MDGGGGGGGLSRKSVGVGVVSHNERFSEIGTIFTNGGMNDYAQWQVGREKKHNF